MESITCIYTRKDNIRIFLRHYYHSGRKWVRRVVGPLIILLGIFFYVQYNYEEHNFFFGVAAFAMGYGIYYTIKPFLTLVLKRKQFVEDQVALELGDVGKMKVTDSSGTVNLALEKIDSAVRIKGDLVITFDRKASLYLLAHGIQSGNLEAFESKLLQRLKK